MTPGLQLVLAFSMLMATSLRLMLDYAKAQAVSSREVVPCATLRIMEERVLVLIVPLVQPTATRSGT